MYGKDSNNNELFNILKEERLFSNASKKSWSDLDKLNKATTEKLIHQIFKDKL